MHNHRIVGIVQARMSSTRLPGKVLKPLIGKPMLARQIERINRCQTLDSVVVATSDQEDDNPIAELCRAQQIKCFRGSLGDVLDRYYRCAQDTNATHVVRLTGDCPLTDPVTVDELVRFYLACEVDYASNCRPPSLPDGLDAEVFSFKALVEAWSEASDPYAREHVVPFIVRQPNRFSAANWSYAEDLSSLRWTVDEPEDLAFVTKVYERLYPVKADFSMADVLGLLRSYPELSQMNVRFERNQGSRRN
jgi:spore coat polysaccharide biosynthesis protein SpsF (cytidylyltransferase family)